MTPEALEHCARAEGFIARGEHCYRKAGEEILAARDEGATWTAISDKLKRTRSWCIEVANFAKTPANTVLPAGLFGGRTAEQKGRGMVEAKRVLREATPEQLVPLLDDPQIGINVAKAAAIHEEQTQQRVGQEQMNRARHLVAAARTHGALSGLVKAKVGLASTLRELQRVPELGEEDRRDFVAIVDEIKLEIDWIQSYLSAGTTDIDSELAMILEGS